MKARALRLDLFRLRRRPALWIGLPLLLVAVKGAVFLGARAGAFGGLDNGFAFLSQSAADSLYLGAFLLGLYAAASLSGEYAAGMLRMYLPRPVSRANFFIHRSLHLSLVALGLVVLDALAGTLLAGAGFGFSDVADPALQGPQFAAAAMARASVEAYVLTFAGTAALASMGLVVSLFFRTAHGAMGVMAALLLVMEGVRVVFREPAATWMLTTHIRVHMDSLAQIARGIAVYRPPEHLFRSVSIPLLYWGGATLVGLLRFRGMDIRE